MRSQCPRRVNLDRNGPSARCLLSPDSDQTADIPVRQLRATSGLMHRSKQPGHSITSSAIASMPGGMARPSTFAVLRLITSSNLLDCTTGRSAGLAPFRIFAV
jgi:hypothetical protein